jgi:membrane-bound lytic murein transglycosylase D
MCELTLKAKTHQGAKKKLIQLFMGNKWVWLVSFLLLIFQDSSFSGLPVSPGLQGQIDFWIRIYTEVSGQEALVHDARYPEIIYEKIQLGRRRTPGSRRLAGRRPASRTDRLREGRKKWRAVLLSLHAKQLQASQGLKPLELTADEAHVASLFQGHSEPDRFLRAANRRRLRTQIGSKEGFESGLTASKKYLPEMEKIFERAGLPVELTRLPFVESSFNLHAISKVGASGIWQFMRSTGGRYLVINEEKDERNDPLLATEAAAKLLKANYGLLQDWPLAVTSYNHGRKFVLRLLRAQGVSDFEEGVLKSRFRRMGFSSRNFYACLLAAIEVEKRRGPG